MKKLLLLSLALSLTVCAFSQNRARISSTQKDQSIQRVYSRITDEASFNFAQPANPTVNRAMAPDERQIGSTFYDQQTNASLGNRFYRYADGTMAFVWTRGMTAGSWADRGTGYNYFDGTNWGTQPVARIETMRVGWPSYAPLGVSGEMVVTHKAANLNIATRAQKGTGAWTETTFAGPTPANTLTWPRVVTAGTDHNSIHLLASSYAAYEGQAIAMLYSRSQDGGTTWDISNTVIPGTGSDSYTEINADEYIWAEPRANTLAFIVSSKWMDMFLMKSTDNGDTWTKTMIWEHPYPMWDWTNTITTDTVWCPESASVALDKDGKAHVAFGIGRIKHDATGETYNFWPYTDGIGYWNEDMPPFTNENQHKALCTYPGFLVENENLIGWMQDMDGDGLITLIDPLYSYNPQIGNSTMPNITVDDNNAVIVAYSSSMENLDNTVFNYKHIWMRGSSDGGNTWRNFSDVTGDPLHAFDECIYPQLAANGDDGNVHLMYNADDSPGLTLVTIPDHDPQENRQTYSVMPKTDFINVNINTPSAKSTIELSEIYPNPGTSVSQVSLTLTKAANVSIKLQNMVGQVVSIQNIVLQAGVHMLPVDGSNLNAGVYFYCVKAGDTSITRKLVIK